MTPTYEEFYQYFEEKVKKHGDDAKNYTEWLETKFESWSLNGWKKEKGTKLIPIKNWRSTLLQCIPYRMPNKVKNIKVITDTPPKKIDYKLKMTEEEKENNAYLSAIYAYDEFKQKGRVSYSYHTVYDTLRKKGLIQKLDKENTKRMVDFLNEKYPEENHNKKMNWGKVHLVEDCFRRCKVHVKELI